MAVVVVQVLLRLVEHQVVVEKVEVVLVVLLLVYMATAEVVDLQVQTIPEVVEEVPLL